MIEFNIVAAVKKFMSKDKNLSIYDSETALIQHPLRHALCALRFLYVDWKIHCLIGCNFTPTPRHGCIVGVPVAGFWREALNSDARVGTQIALL